MEGGFRGWPRSARQARGHAIVLAIVLWIAASVVTFSGSDDRSIAGPLKGADFVHFYTLGQLARSHQIASMYDAQAFHQAQVDLVPESRADIYPPVYPPQAALLFAPFGGSSYRGALLLWCVCTIVLYALVLWGVWRRVAGLLPDRVFVIAAAAAFPPFWSVILYGQVTIVPLVAFWAGWLALERRRPYLAGLAFGLLALKPQLGIPLAVVVLACGEWAMLAGAVSSVAVQAIAVWLMLGPSVFRAFVEYLPVTVAHVDALEAKPFLSHSLRALTRLAPTWIGLPLWLAVAAAVLWYTVRLWRSRAPTQVRVGAVILASILVSPHLIVYDVTLLALPLLWFGAYVQERRDPDASATYWTTVYWLFAALLMPTAAVIGVQVSVLLMAWLFVQITRAALTAADLAPAGIHDRTSLDPGSHRHGSASHRHAPTGVLADPSPSA